VSDIQFEDVIKKSNIDFSFITELEPQSEKVGYTSVSAHPSQMRAIDSSDTLTPNSPHLHSSELAGVVVGIGFDLGSHTSEDLRKIGLNATLRGKLYPYLRRTGADAVEYLSEKPLILSEAEVKAIDLGNRAFLITKLVNKYNDISEVDFADLSSPWQTVLASIACQYNEVDKKFPQFWLAVTTQDWDKALHILKNFGDSSPARRHREANYILEFIDR
jgi:hypothetical protein